MNTQPTDLPLTEIEHHLGIVGPKNIGEDGYLFKVQGRTIAKTFVDGNERKVVTQDCGSCSVTISPSDAMYKQAHELWLLANDLRNRSAEPKRLGNKTRAKKTSQGNRLLRTLQRFINGTPHRWQVYGKAIFRDTPTAASSHVRAVYMGSRSMTTLHGKEMGRFVGLLGALVSSDIGVAPHDNFWEALAKEEPKQ